MASQVARFLSQDLWVVGATVGRHNLSVSPLEIRPLMSKRIIIFLGIGLLLIILCYVGSAIIGAYLILSPMQDDVFERTVASILPTPVNDRTISPQFNDKIIWHRGHFNIRHYLEPSPGLIASHQYLAFVTTSYQLNLLDVDTGITLWQSEPFSDYEAFAVNKDKAFVLLDTGSPLNIYDINGNSSPIGTFDYFREFTHFYIFPTDPEDRFYVYYYDWRNNLYNLQEMNLEGKK